MGTNAKISIITPSYNQAQYIEQTIDSVLSQNYTNLEYMIIDGGSTDGSVEIIKRYAKHLAYWVSEPDHGQSHAINKGLKRATGDVINWLNSDDYYEPDALKIVSEVFQNPEVTCFCGRSRIFDNNGTIKDSKGTDVYPDNIAKTIGWARIDQPETFFRRQSWEKVGLLNEQLHYTMDREWWVRYLFSFGLESIVQNEALLVNFRFHDNSKSIAQQGKFDEEWNSFFYLLAKMFDFGQLANTIKSERSDNPKLDIFSYPKDPDVAKKAMHYFALSRADQYYYISEYQKSKAFLKCVEPKILDSADMKLYKSLTSKMKIPQFLLSILR